MPEGGANTNYVTGNSSARVARGPILSVDRIPTTTSNNRPAHPTVQQAAALRPEVQNAMRALREMPPFVREREIETGRYSHFSPKEKEFLRSLG